MAGNARGAGVEVQIGIAVEAADLRMADLVDEIATANGQIAAAGAMRCFEHRDRIALAAQFVGGGQTGDARAENRYRFAVGSGERRYIGSLPSVRLRHQSESERGLIDGGRSADGTDQVQESAARQCAITGHALPHSPEKIQPIQSACQ